MPGQGHLEHFLWSWILIQVKTKAATHIALVSCIAALLAVGSQGEHTT